MPTCLRCRIAYLDGESHKCSPADSPLMEAISTLGGIIAGGTTGYILGWIGYMLLAIDEGAPVAGLLCAPLGAMIGGMIAARAARNSN